MSAPQDPPGFRPFPEVAMAVLEAGYAPLPLPEGRKKEPPAGWTGGKAGDRWPSGADVHAWSEDPRHARANTAARFPREAVALDVDMHHGTDGGAIWGSLVAEHGEPPATWILSARGPADPGGHRLFRLPEGVDESTLGTGLPGIDVLRHSHRYTVAPGSVNPDAGGAVYACWHEETGEVIDTLPPVASLPVLPMAWVQAFTKGAGKAKAKAGGEPHRAFTDGQPCQAVVTAYAEALDDLGSGRSRHDAATAGVARLVRLGDQGHAGVLRALRDLRAVFVGAVSAPRIDQDGKAHQGRTMTEAVAEFRDMAASAVGLVDATPTPDDDRGCCRSNVPPGAWEDESAFPGGNASDEDEEDPVARFGYLDWATLWGEDEPDREYLVPRLWTVGASGTIYSGAGVGKSLLALEWAAALALGLPIMGEPVKARTVLYVDQENDRALVRERLEAMGLGGVVIDRLHYSLLGDWPPLDTAAGGAALLAEAQRVSADLVVIDTTARVISGEENVADTFHALYRHALRPLKAAGVAVIRLDHAGKDATKGERGSSAKRGDVDLAYSLALAEGGNVILRRVKNRLHLESPEVLTLRRVADPLRHEEAGTDYAREDRVAALVAHMDRLEIPTDWGRDRVRRRLAEVGVSARNEDLTLAIGRRRLRDAAS